MKKVIGFVILILAGVSSVRAQEKGLPEEKCIVYLQNGKQVTNVTLWQLKGNILEYEKGGSLHDLAVEKITSIRCGDLEYEAANDTLVKRTGDGMAAAGGSQMEMTTTNLQAVLTPESALITSVPLPAEVASPELYYRMGKADGKKYYNGTGAFISGLLTAPLIIVPPIIAAVPPSSPGDHNPNESLYYSNENYNLGFKKAAHGKKAVKVLEGLGAFVLAMTLTGMMVDQ